ncbi:MAG: hypothetical protein H0U57_06505 [Tatlockia sp.]|nr:hypothetical protein [Tatlockia sp.]
MSIQFVSSDGKPPKGSLVVCAGTVTSFNVKHMGSGFLLFKTLFKDDLHADSSEKSWSDSLQDILNKYHEINENMPSYIRIAQQDGLIGGVATVPLRHVKGLEYVEYANKEEMEAAFLSQYKQAVRLAILDAIKLNRPLFIQPLGIGVYGWLPEVAARLFVEAISEVDPSSKVDITIPLYDSNENSKDQQFKKEFLKFSTLAQGKNIPETSNNSDPIVSKQNPIYVLRAFRKIYEALYEGQTSFFKTPKKRLSYNEIVKYSKEHPTSRTAKAWELAQLHHHNPTSENQKLFKSIHQYCFENSSSFFSLFRQSRNFSRGYEGDLIDTIDNAHDDSRTGKIRNALNN